MIERSPGTKTRRLLLLHEKSDSPDDKSNKQSTDSISNIRKRSKISCQSQLQDISQLNAATMECESFETLKSNFINLLDLCKYETYRNNDRCFRIFLLATKFLSDANAMKMFNAFYSNKMFLQLSDFYICWTQRCRQSHNIIRSILIKAERMDAKPKCAIDIQKRQFAIKEEELILSNNDNKANSGITQTIRTSIYPWDIKLQAELMNYMQVPNFIKFYNRKMPPFNFMFDKLSFPKQTSNDSLNYICSIKSIPDRYFILKIRPKHQSYWEAYIYHYVKEELRLISGIVEIYHCLTFIDKCLTVQEFTAGTLKELINIQNFDRTKKLNELIIAIIILDLMKILRCIHQMNIIHGCFRSDNIFIAKRLICKPQLGTLNNGTTLILKLANWDFAIRDIDGRKYDGQYINENKVITDDDYKLVYS
ncbi:Checkpoint serine/threonine-protein kinase [Dirofilaria immitis]